METEPAANISINGIDNYELANIGLDANAESSFNTNTSPRVGEDGPNVQELAPIDGGRQAWTFCASAFALETLVWGFGFR